MKLKTDIPEFVKVAVLPSLSKIPTRTFLTDDGEKKFIFDASLISILIEKLPFKFEILEVTAGMYGAEMADGNWTGIIGMLQREEADIAIGKISYSEQRASVVDFSYPYQYTPITFITDNPKYIPDEYAILHPFSAYVWVAVCAAFVVMSLVLYIFRVWDTSFQSTLLKIFASLLEKSIDMSPRMLGLKFLLLSWVIGAMFITFSYKAVLLSFLSFPSLTGIRDIKELSKAAEKNEFLCSSYKVSNVYIEILNSGGESWQKIGKCLIRTNMFTNDVDSFLRPTTYRKAFIGINYHLALSKGYYLSEDAFYNAFVCIAIKKSFCCKEALDKLINRIHSVGILSKLERDEGFFLSLGKEHQGNEEIDPMKTLTLEDFYGAFIILVFGHVVAILTFFNEFLWYKNFRKE